MGLKLFVNNEEVWESEGDATLVSSVSGSTAKGEFGRLGVANDVDRVDLFISVRDPIESSTDLDLREAAFRNQNSEALEKRIKKEGPSINPANTVLNETLEESRNPSKSEEETSEPTPKKESPESTSTGAETKVATSVGGPSKR